VLGEGNDVRAIEKRHWIVTLNKGALKVVEEELIMVA
jgi:hypothetical protein